MNVQHLESDQKETPDLEDYSLPDKSAREDQKPPEVTDGDETTQDESWEQVNARLKSKGVEDDGEELSEVEKLKAELAKERQEKATFEKRMKDSQRAFKERSEELKRIREEQESSKASIDQLKDDVASGDIAAPQNKSDVKMLAKKYNLTEDQIETIEIYPEFIDIIEKVSAERLELGLSEREKQREIAEKEARAKVLEQEIAAEEYGKWLKGVKSYHKDAEKLLSTPEWESWIEANEPLRRTILATKQKYDPSGLVELIDHYKEQSEQIARVRAKRQFNRQSSVTPSSVHTQADDGKKDKTWAQINAELKKQRSR